MPADQAVIKSIAEALKEAVTYTANQEKLAAEKKLKNLPQLPSGGLELVSKSGHTKVKIVSAGQDIIIQDMISGHKFQLDALGWWDYILADIVKTKFDEPLRWSCIDHNNGTVVTIESALNLVEDGDNTGKFELDIRAMVRPVDIPKSIRDMVRMVLHK